MMKLSREALMHLRMAAETGAERRTRMGYTLRITQDDADLFPELAPFVGHLVLVSGGKLLVVDAS